MIMQLGLPFSLCCLICLEFPFSSLLLFSILTFMCEFTVTTKFHEPFLFPLWCFYPILNEIITDYNKLFPFCFSFLFSFIPLLIYIYIYIFCLQGSFLHISLYYTYIKLMSTFCKTVYHTKFSNLKHIPLTLNHLLCYPTTTVGQ